MPPLPFPRVPLKFQDRGPIHELLSQDQATGLFHAEDPRVGAWYRSAWLLSLHRYFMWEAHQGKMLKKRWSKLSKRSCKRKNPEM
jgi:hypothetical protein